MALLTEGGSNPLAFTFIPASGILPSQVLIGKDSSHLPKLLSYKDIMAQKKGDDSKMILEKKIDEPSESFSGTHHKWKFGKEEGADLNNPEEIRYNDLFIAEFVVVMDSDDGDEEIKMKKSEGIVPFEREDYECKGIQKSTTAQPKAVLAAVNDNGIYPSEAQQFIRDMGDQELQHPCSVSTTCLDSRRLQFPNLLHPSKGILHDKSHSTSPITINKYEKTTKHIFHEPLSSQKLGSFNNLSAETPKTQPVNCLSSTNHSQLQSQYTPFGKCSKSNILTSLPIQIIKYPLCRSPSPLNSSFYGSSSTICSVNDSTSPIPKPEVTSSAPSRLSFLTSLLKSKNSNNRSFSPDLSYPKMKTTSQHSVFYNTARTSSPPRKSQSCFSLNYPKDSKCSNIHRNEVLPTASDSDILHGKSSFYSKTLRSLSPQSVRLKSSSNSLLFRKGAVSPSSQLPHQLSTASHSSGENISPLNEKPPLNRHSYTKKYSVLGKSKRITLFPPPLPFHHSSPTIASHKQNVAPYVKKYVPVKGTFRSSYNLNDNLDQSCVRSPSPMDIKETYRIAPFYPNTYQLLHENVEQEIDKSPSLYSNHKHRFQSYEELSRNYSPTCTSPTNILGSPRSKFTRSYELQPTSCLSLSNDQENQQSYKIKSSYRAFAAIPTNTLLRDQKAIDKPAINRVDGATSEEKMDTHSEMCSPALLRQQTEEICAAIDEVLQDDPLPTTNKPASKPAIKKKETKSGIIPRTPPKSAGRETKYASIQHLANRKTSNFQTKPGVIRPLSLKISAAEHMDEQSCPPYFQQFSMPQYRRDQLY